ncbi:MAG: 50S ribosomal protein L18e [Candidatus Micrarchaeia archaeon]
MIRGTEKEDLKQLIVKLKKLGKNNAVWKTTAEMLQLPRRRQVVVNISKVAENIKDGEVALVPGKLLGDGLIETKIIVAAYAWTDTAKKRIEGAGGKVMAIEELIKENPKGTGVRILR